MEWPTVADITTRAPLPPGYRYEYLDRGGIAALIAGLEDWYPSIAVGTASCHLRAGFYLDKVSLGGTDAARDFAVVLFKRGDELCGMYSTERDCDSGALYGRICAIAPAHRGAHLSRNVLMLEEALGRGMGMGMIYGLATLRYRQMQATFERMGWQLVGITPGFDRELVAPGVVKRVYEAVYAKVLVAEDELLPPRADDMTPAARALFDLLYPGRCIEDTP